MVSLDSSQEVLGRVSAVLEDLFGACVDICTLLGRGSVKFGHDGVFKGSLSWGKTHLGNINFANGLLRRTWLGHGHDG